MLRAFNIKALPAAALLLLVFSTAASNTPPVPRQVKRARFWTAPDHTRVVLDMSSESSYRIRVLANPHRIAIDIPSGRFDSRVKPIEVDDGVLTRIRMNKLRSGAQVVLDLPRKTTYRDFALKPFKGRPHRIVIDLKRPRTAAEIRKERERVERIATSGDRIVIIDPGHGGHKPGAVSRWGLQEKDVVLEIAKLTAREIDRRDGFKAVLTRKGDYNVGLARRIEVARSHGGHCYVSIHVNANRNTRLRGSEVYFLSLEGSTDENAEAVAERENLFLQMDNEMEEMNDDLKSILFDLNRTNSMNMSSLLAAEVAYELKSIPLPQFRAVKQANFVVLRSIAMPSVLVEVAYLSNRKDEKLLRKNEVLQGVAEALTEGIVSFFQRYQPQEAIAEARMALTHVVAEGETLWGIARRYGISIDRLKTLNGLGRSSRIHPGQKLLVHR